MKKTSVLIITFLMASVSVFAQMGKVGVVDSGAILAKSKKGNTIRQKMEKLQKEKQDQAQTMQEQIKKLQQDLLSPALNAATKQKKSEELNQKQIALKRYLEDSRRVLDREFQKELLQVEKQIMPLLRDIGKTKGLIMIFDVQKSGLAHYDKSIDITADVIKAFDAKYPNQVK